MKWELQLEAESRVTQHDELDRYLNKLRAILYQYGFLETSLPPETFRNLKKFKLIRSTELLEHTCALIGQTTKPEDVSSLVLSGTKRVKEIQARTGMPYEPQLIRQILALTVYLKSSISQTK